MENATRSQRRRFCQNPHQSTSKLPNTTTTNATTSSSLAAVRPSPPPLPPSPPPLPPSSSSAHHHGNRPVRILTSVRQKVPTCQVGAGVGERTYLSTGHRCCQPRSASSRPHRDHLFLSSSLPSPAVWILTGVTSRSPHRIDTTRVTAGEESPKRERQCRREGRVGGAEPGFMEPPHG